MDLGIQPPSNNYLNQSAVPETELRYPLQLLLCDTCGLLQTCDFALPEELFQSDYAYMSSTTQSWLNHAKAYCDMIATRLNLTQNSFVVELASNDGYLLHNFVETDIPCLGIEPTQAAAKISIDKGIDTWQVFFGRDCARRIIEAHGQADLICGNNVLAHVPNLDDFVGGVALLLDAQGTATFEFPHLSELVSNAQFDTIYHEHFSYFSLACAERFALAHGLRIYAVERLLTHGGSLRIYLCHESADHKRSAAVSSKLDQEYSQALNSPDTYLTLQNKADEIRISVQDFLQQAKHAGKCVAAYGAAAKGNTLLNFAGITTDLIPKVYDAAPSKQSKLLPGSRIPIFPPDALCADWPDYLIVLPWNIFDEVVDLLAPKAPQRTKFVRFIPKLSVT